MAKNYMLVGVDVRRAGVAGSARPNLVEKLTLSPINFITSGHNPGGGVGNVEFVQPRIEAPEPKFAVKGVDTDIFDGFGTRDRWVFTTAFRDLKVGAIVSARVVIEGAIASWEPDETSPEEFQGCTHTFKEVTHYAFRMDKKERWYWDFFERELRVDGKDYMKEIKKALG